MFRLGLASLVTGTLVLTGCGGSSSSTDAGQDSVSDQPTNLSLPFKAVAGDEPVACGNTYQGIGLAGTDITFADFRVFVHDVALITDQGETVPVTLTETAASQNADVALLDFRDTAEINENDALVEVCGASNTQANPGYNRTVEGTVTLDPAVTVSSIRFAVGVPFSANHANAAAAEEPLRVPGLASGMNWGWQAGYKFTGIDVLPVGGITRPEDASWTGTRWNLHLGSTGCEVATSELENGAQPEACRNPNRVVVELPLNGLTLAESAIQIDYSALVSGSNLGQDDGGAPGCMSGQTDPECEAIFERLALPWGNDANAGGNPNVDVFSIVER